MAPHEAEGPAPSASALGSAAIKGQTSACQQRDGEREDAEVDGHRDENSGSVWLATLSPKKWMHVGPT